MSAEEVSLLPTSFDVSKADPQEFNLFLERPPDQSERWARQLRCFNSVQPPYSHLDPVTAKRDKLRFVENLWAAQAKARKARGLISDELDLEEPFNRARCYWSLFTSLPAQHVSLSTCALTVIHR